MRVRIRQRGDGYWLVECKVWWWPLCWVYCSGSLAWAQDVARNYAIRLKHPGIEEIK